MRKLRFPVYGKGTIEQSVRGRCAFGRLNIKVHLGSVSVRPSDLVMGDVNGIVVVPQKKTFEILQLARQSAQTDRRILKSIARGMNPVRAHHRANYERDPDSSESTHRT